jgi:hypothetical protein
VLLITGTYQPSTSRSRRRRARSPLPRLIILGNDDAAQFDIGDLDAGPTGQLVIVDATDDDSIMESRVTELHAASIMVTDVLPSTRPAEEATLLPIGDTIPWTCGVSDGCALVASIPGIRT